MHIARVVRAAVCNVLRASRVPYRQSRPRTHWCFVPRIPRKTLLEGWVRREWAIASTLEQMTKQQLVEAVSVKTGRESAEVENVLEAVLGSIAEALSSNERVDLRGFGSFTVKDKKERQGRNPRTGETITIAAKRDASFKPGKELSEKLILPKTEAKPA
jgi:nucleoid DNA-binding protein